jgi:hypothetical protein
MKIPQIKLGIHLALSFVLLTLALFPGGFATGNQPEPNQGTVDAAGNQLNSTSEPSLSPQQSQQSDADLAILCYSTQTDSRNPCNRVSALFTGVSVISTPETIPNNLAGYDVIYIGYSEASSLSGKAPQLQGYVNAGGGLVVEQPNTLGNVAIFPPGFELTVTDTFWAGFPNPPGPDHKTLIGFFHPILNGITTANLSGNFEVIPVSTLGPGWTVLAKAVSNPNLALAVGAYGSGRMTVHAGNISNASSIPGSDAYVRQMIEWTGAANEPAGPDMVINKIEVTQAIQDLNNSVDLIANKRTYVRVHVSSPTSIANVSANLSARRGSTTLYPTLLPGNPGSDITVRATPNRGQINDSYWFELPTSWTTAGNLTITARLDPANAKNDPNRSNNFQSVTVNFQSTPAMRLRLFNVQYTIGSNTYLAATTHLDMLESWLRRAYPINSLIVNRQTFIYPNSGLPNVDTLHGYLAIAKLLRILFSSEIPNTYYYAMVDDGGGFMRGKAAGIPGKISAGPTGPGTFGWDFDGSFGDWYGGHEIAHSLNRYHAEYCGAGGGEAYPYSTGRISPDLTGNSAIYGFDITSRTIYPPSWKDVMTYCANQWVSDFTYEGIRDRLVSLGSAAEMTIQGLAESQQYILVAGIADLEGHTAEILNLQMIDQETSVLLPVPGDWEIALVGATNNDLAVYPFSPQELTDAEDSLGTPAIIGELAPFENGTQRVEIRYGGQVVASRQASSNPPVIEVVEPKEFSEFRGPFRLSWEASDTDGDPLTFSVLFSNNGGETWETLAAGLDGDHIDLDGAQLPGGESLLKVLANDGFWSTAGNSQPFVISQHPPTASIVSPDPGAFFYPTQPVALEGTAYDLEDGTIEDDAAFQWQSSISGDLGTGKNLITIDLPLGEHLITLSVTDSNGMTGTDTRSITIVDGDTPEPVYLEVAPGGIGTVVMQGDPADTEPVSVSASSGDIVNWSVSKDVTWLSLDVSSGQTPSDLVLTFNPSGLAAGIYNTVLVFESEDTVNSAVEVPVVLQILEPPTWHLFLPAVKR